MKAVRAMTALGLAGLLALQTPVCSMAQAEKPETMDDQTWARLQDQVLEYDEIGDRVELYNPTYQQVIQNIQVNIQPYEDAAQTLRGSAKDLRGEASGFKDENKMMYQMYRGYAKGYQEAAKNFEKVAKSIKSSTRSTLNSTRKQLTSGVQQLMLGYYQARASKEMVDTAAHLAQAAYDSAVTRRNIGMATELEVTEAEKSLRSALDGQQTLNDTLTSLHRQLLFMTGWSYDEAVEVGAPPVPNLSEIDGMNPENDLTRAIGNNYTLIAQRGASGKGTANHDAKFRTLDESEMKVKIQLESLYQTVVQNRISYEAARTAMEGARLTMDGNEKKYQLGMLGKLEYLQMKMVYLQQKSAADAAALELVQAMESYRWAVEGLADIS